MPVAKSYQNCETIGDIYTSKGRQYIQIKTKSGLLKTVRWYSDHEYAKMYGETVSKTNDPYFKTQKEVLGFVNDFITIFKGNTYEDKDYFKTNAARYNKYWGWYFPSNVELPLDIPDDVVAVRLEWSMVGNEDGTLRSDEAVSAAVDSLTQEPDDSEYQGSVGDKLELYLRVERAIEFDGAFGLQTMHVMRDDNGNCYVWTTAARSWEEGTEHHLIGTVKDHKLYKGCHQTVLTRCREI